MRAERRRISGEGAALLLSLFLCCSTESPSVVQVQSDDYAGEVRLAKETSSSGQELSRRIEALQTKYGFPLDQGDAGAAGSVNVPDVEKGDLPGQPQGMLKVGAELGKTLVTNYQYAGLKWASYSVVRPYFSTYVVPAHGAFGASVTNPSSPSVDPFLVIYKVENGNPNTNDTLQQDLTVLAYNDDYVGLLPVAYWTNNSASSVTVTVLAFAYSQYGSGTGRVRMTVNGSLVRNDAASITGVAMFYDMGYLGGSGQTFTLPSCWQQTPPGNAVMATSSQYANYYKDRYSWGPYAPSTNGDTYLWVFNFAQGRGMANDDVNHADWGSGLTNWFDTWLTMPMAYHYPSVYLLGGYSNGGTAKFLEVSQYNCN